MLYYFFNRCGYLLFTKKTERCPNGKKITLTTKIWTELLTKVDKVTEALARGDEAKFHLSGDKYLIVQKFMANGLWYVGVHDITPAGSVVPFSGLNFDTQEWDMLMGSRDEIDSYFMSNPGKVLKRTVDGEQVGLGEIVMYSWKWFSGKKKLCESKVLFYNEETCRQDAMNQEPKGAADKKGAPTVVIEKVTTVPPCKMLHMKQVYLSLVKCMIRLISQEKCPGCKQACMSQVDHMGQDGCANEEVNHIAMYCSVACERVEISSMVTLFDTTRKQMGATPLFVRVLAEATKYYLTPDVCSELLSSKDDNPHTMNLDMFIDTKVRSVLQL